MCIFIKFCWIFYSAILGCAPTVSFAKLCALSSFDCAFSSFDWSRLPQPMPMQTLLTIGFRKQWSTIPALLMLCGTDLNSSTPMNLLPEKNWMKLTWPGNNDRRPYNINKSVSLQRNNFYHSYQRVQTMSCGPFLWSLWWHA